MFHEIVDILSRVIEQCTVGASLEKYISLGTAISNLKIVVARIQPSKEYERRLASFKHQQNIQYHIIARTIASGYDLYPRCIEALRKQASNDEERRLVAAVEKKFAEKWGQVQIDLERSKEVICYRIDGTLGKFTGKIYMKEFDIAAIRRKRVSE